MNFPEIICESAILMADKKSSFRWWKRKKIFFFLISDYTRKSSNNDFTTLKNPNESEEENFSIQFGNWVFYTPSCCAYSSIG